MSLYSERMIALGNHQYDVYGGAGLDRESIQNSEAEEKEEKEEKEEEARCGEETTAVSVLRRLRQEVTSSETPWAAGRPCLKAN